ncbi:carbohydrate porin [bacterium]|nr:carbohydrate porin [bacterium]
MRFRLTYLSAIILFLFAAPVFAVEEVILSEESIEEVKTENIIKGYIQSSPYLLGDYKGLRTKLQEHGIEIQSSYIIDAFVMRNKTKSSAKGTYQGLYNLSLDLDSEKMKLYKGGKFRILYQVGNKGMNSMQYLNTYSDISSFDPMKSINQISELYYEQSIKDDLFNIKIGKQDANMDFQALNTGFEFLNLAFSFVDNTPMPLFPSQQMGARVRFKLPREVYIQNGFYDGNLKIGASPKSFFTGENNYLNMTEIYKITNFKEKEGKYLIGDWIKTGKYESYKYSTERNNYGIYAGFEQKLTDRFEDKSGGVKIFGQFGYARNSINDVPYYGGGGVVLQGTTEKRKADSIGIAFGWHQFDRQLHRTQHKTAEKVIELFYKIKLTEFLYIQPDFQYIIKPGGNEKNAFAIGLRSCIVF